MEVLNTIEKSKHIGGCKPIRSCNMMANLRCRGYNLSYEELRSIYATLGIKEYVANGYLTISHENANRVIDHLYNPNLFDQTPKETKSCQETSRNLQPDKKFEDMLRRMYRLYSETVELQKIDPDLCAFTDEAVFEMKGKAYIIKILFKHFNLQL